MVHSLAFIQTRLEGAQTLIKATHNYVKWQAPLDVESMSAEQTFKVSSEAMRVTVRLTQIMAWLLLQRATLNGEISKEESFGKPFQVLKGKECLERGGEEDSDLPYRLRDLLKESRQLYERVFRLDRFARQRHQSRAGKAAL